MQRPLRINRAFHSLSAVWAACTLFATSACVAATLQVTLVDPAGKAIPHAVVIATPSTPVAPTISSTPAVMDQVDKTFVPEVLVIRTGAAVIFPNSDSVAHQVYSFSPAKRFALPLYRGQPYPPVMFDRPGIVTLGCNIHDPMVAYIVVTDSPYFGQTDAQGRLKLESLPAGNYRVSVWSPRFAETVRDRDIVLSDAGETTAAFHLTKPPRTARQPTIDSRIRDY